MQGANVFQLMIRIIGPLLRANLSSIWLLVFTGAMLELAASELLYPPGQPTLPVQIVGYFNNFRLGPGMALSMLDVGIVTLALILIRTLPWLIGFVRNRTRAGETPQLMEKEIVHVFADQTAQ